MKTRFIIATAIGVLISAVLLVMDLRSEGGAGNWAFLELPGIAAAYLFWGAVGGSVFLGVAIAFVVNAVVCGAAAFGLVSLTLQTAPLPK